MRAPRHSPVSSSAGRFGAAALPRKVAAPFYPSLARPHHRQDHAAFFLDSPARMSVRRKYSELTASQRAAPDPKTPVRAALFLFPASGFPSIPSNRT